MRAIPDIARMAGSNRGPRKLYISFLARFTRQGEKPLTPLNISFA